jgi:nucleoporin NUP42
VGAATQQPNAFASSSQQPTSAFGNLAQQPTSVFGNQTQQQQQQPTVFGSSQSSVAAQPPEKSSAPPAPDFKSVKVSFRPGLTPYDSQLPPDYMALLPERVVEAFRAEKFEWGKIPDWVPPLELR